jgi:hypothetical protein
MILKITFTSTLGEVLDCFIAQGRAEAQRELAIRVNAEWMLMHGDTIKVEEVAS